MNGPARAPSGGAARVDLADAFLRHRGALTAAATRVLRGRADVDDLVQDVFVEALRGAHNLREPAALPAWLRRVAVRVAGRRRGPARLFGRFVGLDDAPGAGDVADPRASATDLTLLAAVGEVVAELPAERWRPWALRVVDGEGLEEIALLCGCSRTTVKRRIAEVQGIVDAALA
jgi:RNA polymerase sigma-70 factor (ECF subfamily)